MTIAVDFDGTVVKHKYPEIGEDVPGAEETLKKLVQNGHRLILYTMRSREKLEEAEKWFFSKDIPLYAVNKNPSQSHWTISPKVFSDIYIDDAALGCPLIYDENPNERPYVNWEKVNELLENIIP